MTLIEFVRDHGAVTELSCDTVRKTVSDTLTDGVGLPVAVTVGEDTRTSIAVREGLRIPVGEVVGEPEGVFWPDPDPETANEEETVPEEVGKLGEGWEEEVSLGVPLKEGAIEPVAVPRDVPLVREPEAVGLPDPPPDAVTEPDPVWPLKDAGGELLGLWVPLKEPRGEPENVFSGL